MKIEYTTKYKYLVETINNKLNMEIAEIQMKVEAAYLVIAGAVWVNRRHPRPCSLNVTKYTRTALLKHTKMSSLTTH